MSSECTKVASQTVEAAAKSCPLLAVINLDYTAVTPLSLAPLLRNCDRLEVLKVAGVPNWVCPIIDLAGQEMIFILIILDRCQHLQIMDVFGSPG